jgi:hypothetical protein
MTSQNTPQSYKIRSLIESLSDSHKDILIFANTQEEDYKNILLSTARKIEKTLLDILKSIPEENRVTYQTSILNSGSLPIVKLLPEKQEAIRTSYGVKPLNTLFIMAQSASYIRESMKRGFALEQKTKMEILKKMLEGTNETETSLLDSVLYSGNVTVNMIEMTLTFLFESKNKNITIAPHIEKLIKKAMKDDPTGMERLWENLCGIYCLKSSGPYVLKIITIMALLGFKKPHKDTFEDTVLENLIKTLCSSQGRKTLKEETGGLQKWIQNINGPMPASLKSADLYRDTYRAPYNRLMR